MAVIETTRPVREIVKGDVVQPGHYWFPTDAPIWFGDWIILSDLLLKRRYYMRPDEVVLVLVERA